jgi:translocation and assembly module TamB
MGIRGRILSLLKYLLLVITFMSAGIIYSLQMPRLKRWLLNEIQIQSLLKTGVEIKTHDIEFSLFPIGVKLDNLTIKPHGELAAALSTTTIDSLTVSLSAAVLAAGHFKIGKILIVHPKATVFLKADPPKSENTKKIKAKIHIPWKKIIDIPVQTFEIWDAEIQARIEAENLVIQTRNLAFNVEKNSQALKLEIFAPDILLKRAGVNEAPLPLTFATRLIAEEKAIEISALKITNNKNFIIARGVARGSVPNLSWTSLNGRTLAHLDLNEVLPIVKSFSPEQSLPAVKGILNLEFLARDQRGSEPEVSGEVETKNVTVSNATLGNLYTKLKYTGGIISASQMRLSNSAGRLSVQDLVLNTSESHKFSFRVLAEKVELGAVLNNLGLKDPPVHADLQGKIPCEGELTPFKMECAGSIDGSNFHIFTKPKNNLPSKTVVAFDNFNVTSTLKVDKTKIIFPKSLIEIGHSKGESNGEVDFEKGFNFNYHTTNGLDFKDVKSLADLKYDGKLNIDGSTSGYGDHGTIKAHAQSDGFWFEDFGLGAASFDLQYANDHLSFSQIKGALDTTTYNGFLNVDLGEVGKPVTLKTHLQIPNTDLSDLIKIFSRKVTLPFNAVGPGTAEIDASGPVDISLLDYKIRSTFKEGVVARERFKNLRFNVHGVNGHAFADDVGLKKGEGSVTLTGDVLPTGIMTIDVHSDSLHMSDFDAVRMVSENIDGHTSLDIALRDRILHPTMMLTSSVTETQINQRPEEDSNFTLALNSSDFKANGQLFGQKIKTSLVYSLSENGPFSFKFDATDFDFSGLLGLAATKGVKKDYETALTTHIDLAARGGGIWQSTGIAQIDKFYLRHGTTQMKNSKQIRVKFDDGVVKVESLKIDGDNTDLTISGGRAKSEILNLNINGHIDLSLLNFLTPFIKDMGGVLTLSTQIGGKISHPDLLGSAFINKGYFKTDALPHPFENIETDFLFSQSRILVNRLKGNLGGGNLLASGSIVLKEFGNVPVELTGDLLGATLAIPEGLTTTGNFHFSIMGNWFPYLLKGDYGISNGLYVKNFGADASDGSVRRSAYLPKVILQKDFTPIQIDINAQFPKSLTVRNNLMEAEVRGSLQIKGDPAYPLLRGEVNALPNGKIFFRDTPFLITTAKVKIDTINDSSTVYSISTSRVRDWDISLLVQGNMKDPKISLTSSPPLSEQNIVSLLALGLTGEQVDTNTSNSSLNSQASQVVGSALLSQNPLQKELKKKYGVEVRLSQTVDDTRNVSTPRVYAQKQWTPQISTSVGRTIGDRVTRDANIEYKLSRHFSVLGTYEGRDFDPLASTSSAQSSTSTDIFGLDLQYRVEFK